MIVINAKSKYVFYFFHFVLNSQIELTLKGDYYWDMDNTRYEDNFTQTIHIQEKVAPQIRRILTQ